MVPQIIRKVQQLPRASAALLATLVAACSLQPLGPQDCGGTGACPACPVCPVGPAAAPRVNLLEAVDFLALPGWKEGEQSAAWGPFLASCRALRWREAWRAVCARANQLSAPSDEAARRFLEENFTPWRLANPDGTLEGIVTGYYEPLLRGSRKRVAPYLTPLYGPPDDLLTVDLSAVNPELRGMRLRGRLEGNRVVPYYSRAEIARGAPRMAGKEIAWVDDPIEAFFLQVQGSGRVSLDGGETLRLAYADQNGHPFLSIGRYLVERGELKPGEASMQSIKAWAAANPERLEALLDQNPSFVFFRELPLTDPASGPIGALGIPLTAGRSIAVDPRYVPLGAPVFLATTFPASDMPLDRLMLAQDTGGAIRNPVRADFYWGFGSEAGANAGRMRQQGRMWVLLPKDLKPGLSGATP